MSRSLDRERARHIWGHIGGRRPLLSEEVTTLEGLPVQVRMQGITTTLALLSSKEGGKRIVRQLSEWLLGHCPHKIFGVTKGKVDVLELLVRAERPQYVAAQNEAISYLEQMKLLAKALQHTNERVLTLPQDEQPQKSAVEASP